MASRTGKDRVQELQRALYRAAKADSRMPAVKNVGEPCAGEPHARFEVAAGGNRNQSAIAVRNWAPPADPTRARDTRQQPIRAKTDQPNGLPEHPLGDLFEPSPINVHIEALYKGGYENGFGATTVSS